MKKILCICFAVTMLSEAALVVKAVDGGPTGWGWCAACGTDRGPGYDSTHGQG